MKTDFYTCVSLPGSLNPARIAGLALLFFCVFLLAPSDSEAAQNNVEFDHFSTGFPLEGENTLFGASIRHLDSI